MNVPVSLRHLAWIALLVIAPAVAGRGAIVATMAALASLDADYAHNVTIQRDAGHDDFVLCHDSHADVDSPGPAFAPADCADDHRLHAANAESLISRDGVAQLLHDAPFAVVASPRIALATPERDAIPESRSAAFVAIHHQRIVVLRI